jgi:deoxyadenosine/deoxycytidine kinase
MKIIGIGGMPCTGKTTLMLALKDEISKNEFWYKEKYGLLDYLVIHSTKLYRYKLVYILGKYYYNNQEIYRCTDKLSMAVINDSERFLVEKKNKNCIILFEEDRLFCNRFISTIYNTAKDFLLINLYISSEEFYKRRAGREENEINQSNVFLRSRFTKYKNMCNLFTFIRSMPNNDIKEQKLIIERINNFITERGII